MPWGRSLLEFLVAAGEIAVRGSPPPYWCLTPPQCLID
jgi:hypothetical protein